VIYALNADLKIINPWKDVVIVMSVDIQSAEIIECGSCSSERL